MKKKSSETKVETPTNPTWVDPQIQTLTGKTVDLAAQDPHSFIAGPDQLQTQAGQAAAGLTADDASFDSAKTLFGKLMAGGAQSYDPATVHPNSILPNLQAYMSPYTHDVVDSSLADYDFGAGQTRAANRLALAGDDTFGGSGGAIQTALSEDAIDRGRASLSAQLRDQGFTTGAGLAGQDADRRQQAQLANMAAFNRAREFNAGEADTAAARQAAAAQGLAQTATSQQAAQTGAIDTQAQIGGILQALQQAQQGAPLTVNSALSGDYSSLVGALSLLHGQNSTGTSTSSGGLLGTLAQVAQIAAAAAKAGAGAGA